MNRAKAKISALITINDPEHDLALSWITIMGCPKCHDKRVRQYLWMCSECYPTFRQMYEETKYDE